MNTIFETKRLIIREFVPNDAKYLCQLDSNPLVMKYISKTNVNTLPLEYGITKVNMQIARYKQQDGLGVWVVVLKETKEFMGWVCLNELDTSDLIELGYRYLPEYWGKGFGTEVAKRILDHGLNTLKLDKVVAIAIEENKASTRIMEKIGMTYARKAYYYGKDVIMYEKQNKG